MNLIRLKSIHYLTESYLIAEAMTECYRICKINLELIKDRQSQNILPNSQNKITSMVCNQHGHQQDVHAKGLSRCMTSLPCASVISIPKGRIGPQHCLAQQPDFSFALYTSCPIELRILYLFLVSKPVMASSTSTFCFTSS